MEYAVVIPARYESTRLPGKPLIELCGVPMVVRTYRRCVAAVDADRIYVATDDDRIAEVCRSEKIQVVRTSSTCLTGTDRVAECAQKLDADTFLNVQGDEPVFEPTDLSLLLDQARSRPGEVLSGCCPVRDRGEFHDRSVPKVVRRPDGRLLYMTRSAVPIDKSGGFSMAFRQVCAYAYPKAALAEFSSAEEKTPLEFVEDIEILRFLEMGWEVRMIEMSDRSHSVDTREDLARVERIIWERGL